MYPKVMRDFCHHSAQYGDTSMLPTPVFFYGAQPQQELMVEIDPGKTLLVALQSVAADGEAAHKVQFELNGQSRTVRVVRADAGSASGGRPVADPANPWHVAAPMPGGIVSVAVQPGQRVRAGSTLLALEAMKMETHVTADRDAEVASVHVAPGDRVQAKDLMVVLRPLAP
jgi:pyruvate carboxylase